MLTVIQLTQVGADSNVAVALSLLPFQDTIQYAETCATALVAALKITAHLLKAAPVASTTPGDCL